jgi:site-specific recombinase XerD
VSALTAPDVTAFLAGMARIQAPGTTQNTASMLRTFLTWLYADGLIAAPLAGTVPGAYRRRRIRMPALVTETEAAALLAACDRTTAQGLRDYAIVLTLKRMGLRASEIAALTLEDVDWRSGIVVISGKGGRRDQLPLPRDVAEAIIAYLRDGRAAAALDRRLFVRSVAPHRGLTGYGVGHAVARAARRAGLDRVRPHQLRYFAATAMQAAGAPLAEIGQVLRHEDERTTSLYAKVDVAALRPLAPPWPAAPSAPRLPAGAP